MTPLICARNLGLDDRSDAFDLELAAGGQVLCIVSDDQELQRLLSYCTGMALPVRGEVLLDGIATAALSRQQLLEKRRQFGIVTASGGLVANLKLWENIMLPLHYAQGTVDTAAEQRAQELLSAFGYHRNLFALPAHLSLFERRVAAFVRAAITGPRVMLYAGCFDNLTADQRQLLLNQAQSLHLTTPGLASLYLTTRNAILDGLPVDVTHDLKRHDTASERPA